jgi:hypothetical protein
MLIHAGKGSRSFERPKATRQTITIPNILPSAASHSTNRVLALGDKKMVQAWRDKTPEGFGFSLKVPQTITHEKVLVDRASLLVLLSGHRKRLETPDCSC